MTGVMVAEHPFDSKYLFVDYMAHLKLLFPAKGSKEFTNAGEKELANKGVDFEIDMFSSSSAASSSTRRTSSHWGCCFT
ncbi:hypothetical protein ACFYO0_14480 [Streptomyces sp. NPDC006365]|uniref:hypothetical protein n=1 Tax=Streptomyces sp. NPDC006365 TaxID=3364744 RepID=UPI0036740E44